MLFLLLTVCTALVGGLWPALVAAVLSSALINWFFTQPLYTLTISDPQNLIALLVFLGSHSHRRFRRRTGSTGLGPGEHRRRHVARAQRRGAYR